MKLATSLAAAGVALLLGAPAMAAGEHPMSFFVTSVGMGDGANLGGLEGADGHCQQLAEAAGSTGQTWRAYLSTDAENARDRIGSGPWVNAAGVTVADSVEALHGPDNNLGKETSLNEMGEMVNGRGDSPNMHDILTGSTPEGTVAEGMTCENWTSDGAETAGMVGHHDRMGLDDTPPSKSWNSSHSSRGGCGLEALRGTGGDGLVYCFAQ